LDQATQDKHLERARLCGIASDAEGPLRLDYVSDLGDGFDATYAIASGSFHQIEAT